MSNYNPDAPFIVGNEWPGIRNENIQLALNQNSFEAGYQFTVPGDQPSRIMNGCTVYSTPDNSNLINLPGGQVIGIAVYAAGTEDSTGPIKRVMINASSGAVSGTDYNALGPSYSINGPSAVSGIQMAATVYDPSSGSKFTFKQPTTANVGDTTQASFWFATSQYIQQLYKKRILAVNIFMNVTAPQGTDEFSLGVAQCPLSAVITVGQFPGIQLGQIFSDNSPQRVGVGEVSPFFTGTAAITDLGRTDSLPWNWVNLGSFDPGVTLANRLGVTISRAHGAVVQPAGGFDYTLNYVAMEIIYCEETRLIVGGKHIVDTQVFPNFGYGQQLIVLWNNPGAPNAVSNAFTQFAILPSGGNYSIFVSAPTVAQANTVNYASNGFPPFNAMRPYYDLSTIPGLQINKPWPVENAIGQQFQAVRTEIIPQISIGASGFPFLQTYAHVYGRRDEVGVYGGVSPSQSLDLSSVVVGSTFPQVRLYARHFNDTLADLGIGIGGSVASISVPTFNALPEILDGWREVTLPFDVAYTTTGSGTASLVAFDTGVSTLVADDFENGLSAWGAPSGCTFAIDNAHVRQGNNAAKMVVVGSPTQAFDRRAPIPVTPGQSYTATIWAFATGSTTNVQASIDWTDASGNFISGNATTITLGANAWTPISITAVAPAGAAFGSYGPTLQSSPVTGKTIWVDSTSFGLAVTNTIANRWEILGLTAFGYGNFLNSAANAATYLNQQSFPTDIATYLAPNGSTAQLTWVSPPVSAIAADPHSDAVAMLSQNPPSVVGLTAALATQTFNVNIDCAVPPQAIPTGMSYVQVTWSAATVTGSGFAYYELQRQDTFDTTWNTIAKISNKFTVSFKDYEARVGIASTYRIRIGNVLAFAGPFASSSPVTVPTPGVGGLNVGNSILIFTTNADQTGVSNLGYTTPLGTDTSEDYTFVEANRSQLQVMYGKNFLSAFQPTERGGEQFTRTLEVNNAAGVAGPVSEAAFSALRNTAWSVVPYVCVRNELGDRWFANINVPSGSLQRNRRLQLAQVVITEISQLPYAVPL